LTACTKNVMVEVGALDEVAQALAPPIIDDFLINMDVQGFEDRVIRGGGKTFAGARACIIEVQRAKLYAASRASAICS
jgi:FkbM family methyltransferase